MSSMWRAAFLVPVLLATAPSSSAQYATPSSPRASPYSGQSIAYAVEEWRRLRQSSGYSFATYASFLAANHGWPDEGRLRTWAERAMRPGENPSTVIAFFARNRPETGSGWARLADSYDSMGRPEDALDAARSAFASPDLGSDDEHAIWSHYGSSLTRADFDRRVDALLVAGKSDSADRLLSSASPERQAAFGARIAMQQNSPDAERRYQAVMSDVTSDAGLMLDRARYLRARGYNRAAEDLAARPHHFVYKPADPVRFYDMLLQLGGEASNAQDWATAYNIARQVDDSLPQGAAIADQPVAVRDDYTSLSWLAGTVAAQRMREPSNAVAMFDRYARAGHSLQVQTKGDYWAGRSAVAAGQYAIATIYFQRAAAYPDLFYGQLSLERLGRSVPAPPLAMPQSAMNSAERQSFNSRRLVQALRYIQLHGQSGEATMFVQALARSLDNDVDRNLALELAQQLGRQDLPVWVSRMARIKGSSFYVRQAYPTLSASLSPDVWSLAHGISRQESSFDPYALSHAGARGIMQLMVGTARGQAEKLGMGFDSYRLLTDPNYNVRLGASYFEHELGLWNGSIPLAVASYNAGSGNVGKWVRTYGDPRNQVDVIGWIEAIPFQETRSYVERVIENSVVYDSMHSQQSSQTAFHVSRYLGKSRPG